MQPSDDPYWRVIVRLESRGEMVASAHAPHRAGAKFDVRDRVESDAGEIVGWGRTYIPRASWDCPVCGCSEGLTEMPNLRGDHDWECANCFSKAWGEPLEFDKIERGPPKRIPAYRRNTREKQDAGARQARSTQTTLQDSQPGGDS